MVSRRGESLGDVSSTLTLGPHITGCLIMPINYKRDYPSDWHEISRQIRFERAGSICECTGECGTDHRQEAKLEIADEVASDRCQAMNTGRHPITNSRVVLTVAHLCQCEPKCGEKSHLKAMCQRCHLRHDNDSHVRNARRNRQQKRIAAGALFDYS